MPIGVLIMVDCRDELELNAPWWYTFTSESIIRDNKPPQSAQNSNRPEVLEWLQNSVCSIIDRASPVSTWDGKASSQNCAVPQSDVVVKKQAKSRRVHEKALKIGPSGT